MFLGTTPSIVAQFIIAEIKRVNPQKVIVPFAGNFVIEQLAGIANKAIEIHSTDISLYSRAIGYGLTDTKSEITLKSEWLKDFPIFDRDMTPMEKASCVIFMTEVAVAKKKVGIKYYDSLYRDAVSNQQAYIKAIDAKLQKFRENCPALTFYGTDGIALCESVKEGDFIFYDPPVMLGDYEKMFKPLEGCFDFNPPAYTQMTDEVKASNLDHFLEVGANAYYRTNNPSEIVWTAWKEVFRYRYKYNASYCVYSNKPENNFVGTFSPLRETDCAYDIIGKDDVITIDSEITVTQIASKHANHYRLLWVRKAQMTDSGTPYGVFCDKKLIGVFSLACGMDYSSHYALILSDPSAPSSNYKRLSKLMLNVICTREVLDGFNEKHMWEHDGFTTRVFSNNPVSMKYRATFDLAKREEAKTGDYKYTLIYQNKKNILPTPKDGLLEWLKKDGKVTKVTI